MVHSRWNNNRINVENLIKCLVFISELPCDHYEKGGWQSSSDAGAPRCNWCWKVSLMSRLLRLILTWLKHMTNMTLSHVTSHQLSVTLFRACHEGPQELGRGYNCQWFVICNPCTILSVTTCQGWNKFSFKTFGSVRSIFLLAKTIIQIDLYCRDHPHARVRHLARTDSVLEPSIIFLFSICRPCLPPGQQKPRPGSVIC